MENKTLSPGNRQTRLFAIIFASLVLLLGLGYYFFLRTEYAVLYTGMRPADASAVVAELKEQAVDYQLRDDGTTILVPADQASSIKLAIVGSDVPLKGLVGFELFNKSDMGLTDFAQKINYQRALQGELSRTIMMMDGVENARVHLALPERSLFRGNRSTPKAAVTVVPAPGKTIQESRVVGIQRLVAAAVPDLALGDVVVLDEIGRVISQSLGSDALVTPEVEERSAVERYYHARVRRAVANVVPGLNFEVRLLILRSGEPASSSVSAWGGETAGGSAETVSGPRDFQLRISVVTNAALNPEDRELVRNAVTGAVDLKEQAGDSLVFEQASIAAPPAAPAEAGSPAAPAVRERAPAPALAESGSFWASNWWLAVGALLVIMLILFRRSRDDELSIEERDEFVERIRRQLQAGGGNAGS